MPELPSIGGLLSARGWLLLLIAIVAFQPALYVWRHMRHAPARRDITLPPQALDWRTPAQLRLNLLLLLGCLALAIFIFTPVAERWARSHSFWPMLAGVMSALALASVLRGLQVGRIEPLIRGVTQEYERSTQPKRFWVSVSWNAFVGTGLLAAAVLIDERSSICGDTGSAEAAEQAVATCTALLAEAQTDGKRADLFAARGSAHYTLNDYPRALEDYAEAIRLDPQDASSLYNRGLIFQDVADVWNAATEYEAAQRIDPKDEDTRARLAEVRAILQKQ